jgi:hypothetical protein
VSLDVPVVLCSEAVRSLAQESERNASQDNGICQRADFRIRPRGDDDQHRHDHAANTNRPPQTRPDKQGNGRGQDEQRRHEPQRTERDRDGLGQLWEVGPAKGLCRPQEVDQTVYDEQNGEGRHHACSRAGRGAAPARRSASRLSGCRESRRIIAIPGETNAQ